VRASLAYLFFVCAVHLVDLDITLEKTWNPAYDNLNDPLTINLTNAICAGVSNLQLYRLLAPDPMDGKFRGSRRNGIWAKGDVTACRGRHGKSAQWIGLYCVLAFYGRALLTPLILSGVLFCDPKTSSLQIRLRFRSDLK